MVYLHKEWFATKHTKMKNNWVSPDEIETINGKKYLKNNKSILITVGPSESMSKSKKIQLIQKILYLIMGQMLLAYSFYLIVLQKKMFNGLRKELIHRINLFKNCGILTIKLQMK